MRIATWNLESVRKLTTSRELTFQKAMLEVDADIWVLTETWKNFGPSHGYSLISQSRTASDLKKWPDRCWVSIWVKSSIPASSQSIRDQSDRMVSCRLPTEGSRRLVIIGTVLPWPSDELWPGVDGFCDALIAQEAEWEALRLLSESCTFVVAGDFNQSIPHRRWCGSAKGELALNRVLQKHNLDYLTKGSIPLSDKP